MFKTSVYVTSTSKRSQSPNKDNLSEFVFLGRSNVGKSSIINALTGKKLLAKVSSKPGKTIAINYFLVNDSIYLVDVPGYGYATRSKEMQLQFGEYIEDYLIDNPNLKIAFLLVDTYVGPTKDDILMYDYLKYLGLKTIVVLTKADKIGSTLLKRYEKQTREKLNDANILITSTVKKIGLDSLERIILEENEKE